MNHASKTGFTLIELMLAMTFISFLLVAIAMTTIQISNIYNKGITLREVNQAGRSVSDELQRSIASSVPFDVDPDAVSPRYIVRDGGGRLCLGQYSYAWNYGDSLAGVSGAPGIVNKYDNNAPVHFAKVSDPNASLCADATSSITRADATEMLFSGDRDLVLHTFTITSHATDAVTGQALYAVSMVIGTNDAAQITASGTSCRPPADGVGLENYCSVNRFDIIARAGNQVGGSN